MKPNISEIIFAILFAALIASNALASAMLNESMDDYKKRYQQTVLPKTVCGDGLCEGREFETCAKDCKKPESVPEENKPALKNKIIIFIFGIGALAIISYLFRNIRKKKELGVWDRLAVSKDYFLRTEKYIRSHLGKGFQPEAIKIRLINAGHDSEAVDKIFEHILKK